MTQKEANPGRSVHRIDLSLPIVQTDSYEIFYTLPTTQNIRALSRQKPFVDNNNNNNNKKTINQTARIRSPARLKHLTGPIFVNLYVDMATMTTESIPETLSNPLVNSVSSNRTSKFFPPIMKRPKQRTVKDDGNRSRSSSGDRLLYESFGSFDDHNINKAKNNNMWQNIHHPQLTSTKTLHMRGTSKRSLDTHVKLSSTTSVDNLSQESTASANEQLYERIEQLTKNYFPEIQQIRHIRPCPELTNNRMHLHREHKRHFMPNLSRTRIVP